MGYKRPTSDLETHTDKKQKDGKMLFYVNGNQKKARVAILISNKINFKIKNIVRDQERHYIIICIIYGPSIGTPQYKHKP